jgi:hypothetical protein
MHFIYEIRKDTQYVPFFVVAAHARVFKNKGANGQTMQDDQWRTTHK